MPVSFLNSFFPNKAQNLDTNPLLSGNQALTFSYKSRKGDDVRDYFLSKSAEGELEITLERNDVKKAFILEKDQDQRLIDLWGKVQKKHQSLPPYPRLSLTLLGIESKAERQRKIKEFEKELQSYQKNQALHLDYLKDQEELISSLDQLLEEG